jgi:hypothetical protein
MKRIKVGRQVLYLNLIASHNDLQNQAKSPNLIIFDNYLH